MSRRLAWGALLALVPAAASAAEGNLLPNFYTLVAAAAADDLATVRQDLLLGENPNMVQSTTGRTALSYAAISGDLAMVALLLQSGARVDIKDRLGNTPLHWAAQKGSEAVTALLDAGSPIDAQNQQGATPLMLAAEAGKLDAVRILLSRKAGLTLRDYTGRTALARAQDGRQPRAQQLLEKAGAGL